MKQIDFLHLPILTGLYTSAEPSHSSVHEVLARSWTRGKAKTAGSLFPLVPCDSAQRGSTSLPPAWLPLWGWLANHRYHSLSTCTHLLKWKRDLEAKPFILPYSALDVCLSCGPALTLFHTGQDVFSLNPDCLVSINTLCL